MSNNIVTLMGVLAAGIFLRMAVSQYSYSGHNTPPRFGDYEAQRHWMEITLNLPTDEWYVNTTNNDLDYWGLDYPPLTAYHSYVCGAIARLINEDYVKLSESRGYESNELKLFMRASVLISELSFYLPALLFYYAYFWKYDEEEEIIHSKPELDNVTEVFINSAEDLPRARGRKRNESRSSFARIRDGMRLGDSALNNLIRNAFIMAIIYPGLILVDHGHFQYNCVSLGLMITAVVLILRNRILPASIVFMCALNFKQMELYHSLPFFFVILNKYLISNDSYLKRFVNVLIVGFVVLLTFILIWLPFMFDSNVTRQLVMRLFPLKRGIFEDYVANFWCFFNVIYKIKAIDHVRLTKLCLLTTLLSVAPSCLDLLLRGNRRKFILALINCSFGFFLFSFHVHEKSILLVAIPLILYFHYDPFVCFWALSIANFSMLPLWIKDGLIVPYMTLSLIYAVIYRYLTQKPSKLTPKSADRSIFQRVVIFLLDIDSGDYSFREPFYTNIFKLLKVEAFRKRLLVRLAFVTSHSGCFLLFLLSVAVEPPVKYPFLFPMLTSVYSMWHFVSFMIYFNYCQLTSRGNKFKSL